MSKRKRITDITVAVILAVLIIGLIALYMLPAGGRNIVPDSGSSDELTYEDYNGKKIGILTGTNLEAEKALCEQLNTFLKKLRETPAYSTGRLRPSAARTFTGRSRFRRCLPRFDS